MGVRHRPVRHRLHARACTGGVAGRASVRRPVEVASRGAAYFSRMSPRCLPRADRARSDVVRIDQYYTSPDCGGRLSRDPARVLQRPDSTVDLQPASTLCPRAAVDGSPGHGGRPGRELRGPARGGAGAYKIHASSGYSPALSAGDFRFVPGQTAEALDEKRTRRIDPEARRGRGLWKGTPIKLETDFIIRRKLEADARGRERRPRHGREGTGLFARSGGHPGFREVWASIFRLSPRRRSSQPRRRASSCRSCASRLTPSRWPRTARPEASDRADPAAVSGRHRPRSAPAISCSSPADGRPRRRAGAGRRSPIRRSRSTRSR